MTVTWCCDLCGKRKKYITNFSKQLDPIETEYMYDSNLPDILWLDAFASDYGTIQGDSCNLVLSHSLSSEKMLMQARKKIMEHKMLMVVCAC